MGKRAGKEVLCIGEDTEREFKKKIKRVPGEVRQSWNREIQWLNSISWKREGE